MYEAVLSDYLDELRAGGSPPTTLRVRRNHLERAFTWLGMPPLDVRHDDLIGYMSAHHYWKPNTRKSVRTSLMGFYGWAEESGRTDDNYARRLPKVRAPKGKPRPTPTEVYEHAMTTARSRQDRLMLMCAALAGLRRSEIARLHSRDIIDGDLHVMGKGGKTRVVPLHELLVAELAGIKGYVFPNRRGDGHLTPQWVGDRMRNMLGEGWSAHTLRHRFASRAYTAERDILAIQDLLGHSSVATTQIYTQVPEDAKRRAVAAVA